MIHYIPMLDGVISMRSMLTSAFMIGSLVCHSAHPCTAGAVDRKTLDQNSDVIATGEIRIVERQERRTELERISSGTAELVNPTVVRNRAGASAPFTFHFEFIEFDGCIFGEIPLDGRRATVRLRLSDSTPPRLELYYVDYEDLR